MYYLLLCLRRLLISAAAPAMVIAPPTAIAALPTAILMLVFLEEWDTVTDGGKFGISAIPPTEGGVVTVVNFTSSKCNTPEQAPGGLPISSSVALAAPCGMVASLPGPYVLVNSNQLLLASGFVNV